VSYSFAAEGCAVAVFAAESAGHQPRQSRVWVAAGLTMNDLGRDLAQTQSYQQQLIEGERSLISVFR